LNDGNPMNYKKKSAEGMVERLTLLRKVFPTIDEHLMHRLPGVGKDDLLDAAIGAWTAQRILKDEARQVCECERDAKGFAATIWY
jgi:predicted RNase H-like nuclease